MTKQTCPVSGCEQLYSIVRPHKCTLSQTSLLNETVPSKVCAPLEFNKFINTSELLGQAKNMRLIKCHKFRELNTALQNIWAEQSVCTSLDENTVTRSVWLGSKNVRKGGGLNF